MINSMSVGSGDINALFEQLKSGLARPLKGMGTAFSSSMLGLAGALVLGFLDLTAGQAQNRFFNELEEWLAGITRLASGVLGNEGEGSVPVYVQALLEQTAENMENLQHILARGEDGRNQANQAVVGADRAHRHAVGHHARQPATDAAHRREPAGDRPRPRPARRTARSGQRPRRDHARASAQHRTLPAAAADREPNRAARRAPRNCATISAS